MNKFTVVDFEVDVYFKFLEEYVEFFNKEKDHANRIKFIHDYEKRNNISIPGTLKRLGDSWRNPFRCFLYGEGKILRKDTYEIEKKEFKEYLGEKQMSFGNLEKFFMTKNKINNKDNGYQFYKGPYSKDPIGESVFFDFIPGYHYKATEDESEKLSTWFSFEANFKEKSIDPEAYNSFGISKRDSMGYVEYLDPTNEDSLVSLVTVYDRIFISKLLKVFSLSKKSILEIISSENFLSEKSLPLSGGPQWYSNVIAVLKYQDCDEEIIQKVINSIYEDPQKVAKVFTHIHSFNKEKNYNLLIEVIGKHYPELEVLYQLQ